MAIDFYYNHLSPPCRAVALTASLLGLKLNHKFMDFKKANHLKPEFVKLNPLHAVPVIVDDGFAVCESHAILSYLCNKYDTTGKLCPKDPKEKARVEQYLFFESSNLQNKWKDYVIPIYVTGSVDPESIKRLMETFGIMEAFLGDHNYLVGDSVTIADLSLVPVVSSAEAFGMEISKYPKVSAWLERLKKLPGYKENNQKGVDDYPQFTKEFRFEMLKPKS